MAGAAAVDNYIKSHLSRIQELVHSISKKIQSEIQERLSTLGITNTQYFILSFVDRTTDCRVSDLAKMWDVKPSAITPIIDKLIAQNLVSRTQDPSDRRAVIVELTDQGQEILRKAHEIRDEIVGSYLTHLTREELEQLLRLYEKLEQIVSTRNDRKG